MNGRRTEAFHYTNEQVRDQLLATLVIIDNLDVPQDLRAIAFQVVYNSLSAKQITVEAIAPGVPMMLPPRG